MLNFLTYSKLSSCPVSSNRAHSRGKLTEVTIQFSILKSLCLQMHRKRCRRLNNSVNSSYLWGGMWNKSLSVERRFSLYTYYIVFIFHEQFTSVILKIILSKMLKWDSIFFKKRINKPNEFKWKINVILQKLGYYRPTDQTEIMQLSYPTK